MSRESRIEEYRLINDSSVVVLNTKINELLGLGWELYGSPNNSKSYWYQAVVRLTPKPEDQ